MNKQNDAQEIDFIKGKLDELYAKIPSTRGCLEHIGKSEEDGGCGAWCCQVQNPQVLYAEFINTWQSVINEWDSESVSDLIIRAVRTYLIDSPTKGCIFWDKQTRRCGQHKTRPLACRVYGIIPDEEWKPRYEQLKVLYPKGDFRPQCDLVKTEDGSEVTSKNTDAWFKELVEIEKLLGVPASKINDKPGGTYRTYHDHLLMTMYPPQVLVALTHLRTKGTEEEKEKFIIQMRQALKNNSQDTKGNDRKESEDH